MKTKLFVTVAALAAFSLGAGPAHAQEKVRMHLDWLVNGYHAAFFVAKSKGWYTQAGLDVTIIPGKGTSDSIRAVGANNAEFGFPDAASAGKAVAEGVPLRMVSIFCQDTPMGVAYYADAGIADVKGLAGKSMASVPQASTAKVLPAFLRKNGVDPTALRLVNHTFATAVPAFLSGQTDTMTGYVFGEFLAVKNASRNREVKWMGFADHGISLYSNGIAVNNEFLKAKPNAVRGFVQASIRGLEFALANPDEAIAIVAQNTETPAATLKEQLMVAVPLFKGKQGAKLGSMTDAGWAETQRIMVEFAEQPRVVPAADLYTTQFLN